MAKSKSGAERRPRPERAWMLLDFLFIGTKTTLFLGPNGHPMIVNDDLRQAIPVRSERLVDYLYLLFEEKLGRHEIPSSSAIKAVQRVLAGKALKEGSQKGDEGTSDPLLDILLAVLEDIPKEDQAFKHTLPELGKKLNIKASTVGYETKDLPVGTAELSKQIRERIEALQIRGFKVEFSRTNSARYVEFTKLDWKPVVETSQPPKDEDQAGDQEDLELDEEDQDEEDEMEDLAA